jgi:ligand-binding SRPBCC domain-containing protein
MWQTSAETRTSAPPEAVWALWADAARWREWNDQIASAELDSPLEQGAVARIRFRRSPRALRFTVTSFEDRRSFTDETRFPGARLAHEHRVEPDGAGSRIVHRLSFTGRAERLWGLVMGRPMRAAVGTFGERERALAEGEASVSSGPRATPEPPSEGRVSH